MNALLVDSPAATGSGHPAAEAQAGHPSASNGGGEPPTPPSRACANCDAPLQDGQQWCLNCGAGQPGSLAGSRGWRPLGALALAALLLVVAAAAAGAAALGSHESTAPKPLTVAQTPTTPPVATTPTTASPPSVPTTPPVTPTPKATSPSARAKGSGTANPLFPSTSKPPTIPAPTSTPKNTGTATTPTTETKPAETKTTTAESKTGGENKAEQPAAILLDTNAASTYNPYKYPESEFGDPALAIDGEVVTAWTAQVQPSSAPLMAVGLLIDLNAPTRLGSMRIISLTPGMTVQVYGANGEQAPTAITEPGWTPLSASRVLKKKSALLKLKTNGQPYRYVVVWIVRAPASAVGTAQAPGHVDLNEVELFPPSAAS